MRRNEDLVFSVFWKAFSRSNASSLLYNRDMYIADTADGVPVSDAEFKRIVRPFVARNIWRFKQYAGMVNTDDLVQSFAGSRRAMDAIRGCDTQKGPLDKRLIAAAKWHLQDEFKRIERQARRDNTGKLTAIKRQAASVEEVRPAIDPGNADEELAHAALLLGAEYAPRPSKYDPRRFTRAQILAVLVLKRHRRKSFRDVAKFVAGSSTNLLTILGFEYKRPNRETLREASVKWADDRFVEAVYLRACKNIGMTPKTQEE